MASCIFPGSFDPVTNGHLDLIRRASDIFDHVTVVVMVNIRKNGCIPAEKRISLLRRVCSPMTNVTVEQWNGLLADFMRIRNETIVIRGIRNGAEMEQEMQANAANRMLNEKIETVFIPCNPQLSGVSSSAVREIAAFGGDIRGFVPDELTEEINSMLSKNK